MDPDEGDAAALLAPDPEPQDPEVDALSVSILIYLIDIVLLLILSSNPLVKLVSSGWWSPC
jgi:hypothetical protein